MQIPKCKYLRASGERVLENIFRLGSTCSVSSRGMWASDWLHCSFLYVNVCEATGCIAGHIASHVASCITGLLASLLAGHHLLGTCHVAGLLYLGFWLNGVVETLEALEVVLVWVWVCSWCEILLLWVPPVLVLSGLSWSVWSTDGSGNSSSSFSETCNSKSIQD